MSTLIGFADHAAGLVGGSGPGIVLAGGGDRITITDWSRPAGIIVAVAGRDGTSIDLRGSVETYADLPSGLEPADRGALYIVRADGLGYAWDGYSWPPDGDGAPIQGPQGVPGRSVTKVRVEGDGFRFTFSDAATTDVDVPALSDARDAADEAEGHAAAAAGSAAGAASSAGAAALSAHAADQDAQATAQDRVQTGLDVQATGADRDQTGLDRAAAETARTGAETAKADAEDARDTAKDHRDDAAGHAGDAAASANQADQHKTAAAGSASTATTAAGQAETWRDQAETFRDEAEGFAQDAQQGAPAGGWPKTDLHADVQDSLGRADSASQPGHGHSMNDVSGLSAALAGKSDTGHTHTTADVDGLQSVIDQAVADLVDGAPGALDTLAELAAAIGDDPNFAATVSQQIGERAKTSDVTAWLADKSDTGHKHQATDITDATSTGRGVLTGTAAQGRAALSVPATADIAALVAQHRPPGIMHSGEGEPPSSISGAKPGDWWLDTETMDLYRIEAV